MPSPFPGMDPYMENRAAWAGVHLHLLANLGQQLAPQIRPRYRVHTERYLTIGDDIGKFRPDLRIESTPQKTGTIQPIAAAISDATLVTETLPYSDLDIPPHLEIVTDAGEVITVIEVLSPINKEGEYNSYLRKRYRLLNAGINLVEIDLLREGQIIPLTTRLDTPYMALVTRAYEYPKTYTWGITWAEPFPVLPVPLRPDESEARLLLTPALAQAYAVEYEGFIDYSADPPGLLSAEWRKEIETILQSKGLR
ncbi:MAG: hypothetical protein BroJett018_11730 [Chloroflexota bacterium]|nr:DUF4058 family protein [Chloroflexota bacterium]NOG64621.1 DUF4058 family protein [Chloroflexota bacterium]GIK63379.1 MAG: hypothetical protein BroJett018_11730 [Chloroflexota bacterium]